MLILTPKVDLTTTNRFENFESDHQYESNLESDVRFEIESNHEASQVPTFNCQLLSRGYVSNCIVF